MLVHLFVVVIGYVPLQTRAIALNYLDFHLLSKSGWQTRLGLVALLVCVYCSCFNQMLIFGGSDLF